MAGRALHFALAFSLAFVTLLPPGAQAGPPVVGLNSTAAVAAAAATPGAVQKLVVVDDAPLAKVPPGFLGFSTEWTSFPGVTENMGFIYTMMALSMLASGPTPVRIGGASAEREGMVAERIQHVETLATKIKALCKEFSKMMPDWDLDNCQFVVVPNFNMAAGDANQTAQSIANMTKFVQAGDGRVLMHTLGNEPNFYYISDPAFANFTSAGGGKWLSYSTDFYKAVNCAVHGCASSERTMAGPDWGGVTINPQMLDKWISMNKDTLAAVTLHHYGAGGKTATAQMLLDEDRQRANMKGLAASIDIARQHDLPLYITESNSISGGGRNDISNALAGMLWVIDTTLEAASAGAQGYYLHNTFGNAGKSAYGGAYDLISLDVKKSDSMAVNPPLYAFAWIMAYTAGKQLQMLANKQTTQTGSAQAASMCKVFPMLDKWSMQLRVVVVNKNEDAVCVVGIDLSAVSDEYTQTAGRAEYITSKSRKLNSKSDILSSWAMYGMFGLFDSNTGVPEKTGATHVGVKSIPNKDGKPGVWWMEVDPATAVGLTIPKIGMPMEDLSGDVRILAKAARALQAEEGVVEKDTGNTSSETASTSAGGSSSRQITLLQLVVAAVCALCAAVAHL